ncbi:MAG: hypothetical protein L0956_07890 [Candidatus Mariimomonas ferrooxydans]
MNTDKEILQRQGIIEYIRNNEPFYSGTSFDAHTLEQLVIIKTQIELKLAKEKQEPAVK